MLNVSVDTLVFIREFLMYCDRRPTNTMKYQPILLIEVILDQFFSYCMFIFLVFIGDAKIDKFV